MKQKRVWRQLRKYVEEKFDIFPQRLIDVLANAGICKTFLTHLMLKLWQKLFCLKMLWISTWSVLNLENKTEKASKCNPDYCY